ncbi:MAG: hypothetical protein Q8922_01780 [Bacteroidota bacterium]|nr:hypothetical protein [Bacteroidota bacterium]MDP4232043.1 hypothetical protein [Bacteroidota bacterium]MDP4241250.1 hypothetical protein [Bacteroidota bacterium]MDP4286642.1 hypothetical protein [Bacteroidota bacterium]
MHPALLTQRESILSLADEIRASFDPFDIDFAALASGIILIRTDGPVGKDAGFAHIEYVLRPASIESIAHPGESVRVWGASRKIAVRSIAINRNAGLPEGEIFWHEYYHLFFSPRGIQHGEQFVHQYSTEGALHFREERRADEFAAAMLVPSLAGCETISDIMEQHAVSERLASVAARIWQHHQL